MLSSRQVVPRRGVVDPGGGECANRMCCPPAAAPGRPTSRDRRGRPLVAALLSCLLPGAGQLYLGYRRRGTVMLVITVLCLAVAVGLWSEPTAVSRMLVQPRSLLALLVADAGLLVFRIVAVLDAYLLAKRDDDRTPAATRRATGWSRPCRAGSRCCCWAATPGRGGAVGAPTP